MTGEIPTPQPNSSENKQELTLQEKAAKFPLLAEKMLETATQHTSSWKRSVYGVPAENTQAFFDDLMQSDLQALVSGLQNPITEESLTSRTPNGVYILAEEFDHTSIGGRISSDISVGLRFADEDGEFNDVRIRVKAGRTEATSYVYSSEYSETGYEGHDWNTQELNESQLQSLYDLINSNLDNLLADTPIEEQMARIKLVNDQTGQELFYDPESKDWKPRDGEVAIYGDEKELNRDNPYAKDLRVTASYRMELIEEEE